MQYRKVIVADDDPTIRRLITHWLETAGYDVREVSDGCEALESARRDCPHFLITDWEMPYLDGIELCRRIRNEGFPHYIYTVLLTHRTNAADMILALETGADDLLTKPIAAPELLARLRAGARVVDLESQLVRLARTDPLTGVPNRWVFFEHFERELYRARRHGLPLCCVLVDIDFFKAVNDSHGHTVGDLILRAFAQTLGAQCRPSDYLCRYGGEEFCVLLTETSEEAGALWAERIRAAMREMVIPVGGKQISITASFGVAARTDGIDGPEGLVDQADDALRIAKHSGRDRVVRFSEIGEIGDQESAHGSGHRQLFRGVLARHIMTTPVVCLKQHQTLADAADLFLRTRINSAPVVDAAGKLAGIISEKDLMANTPAVDGWKTPIHSVMKQHVVCYDEDTPALVIYDFLCRVTIRRVVVVRDGIPTGVISRGTLLRWFGNWQVAGVTQGSSRAPDVAELLATRTREHLTQTVSGLAEHVTLLQASVAGGPDRLMPTVVAQATRIQELASDLLAFSHLNYEFSPEALAAP